MAVLTREKPDKVDARFVLRVKKEEAEEIQEIRDLFHAKEDLEEAKKVMVAIHGQDISGDPVKVRDRLSPFFRRVVTKIEEAAGKLDDAENHANNINARVDELRINAGLNDKFIQRWDKFTANEKRFFERFNNFYTYNKRILGHEVRKINEALSGGAVSLQATANLVAGTLTGVINNLHTAINTLHKLITETDDTKNAASGKGWLRRLLHI